MIVGTGFALSTYYGDNGLCVILETGVGVNVSLTVGVLYNHLF
ncbi:MAG: hypothetical protein N4A33_12170 [Bacteriovoracaceae bacterium]|jgi:hypothetical protein|nr:hypothetical protein [Bacteriovoracaceae bacterium]